MDSSEKFTRRRRALKGFGKTLLRLMSSGSDATWAEWLKAPFELSAVRGDKELTLALMEAGASGNALIPAVRLGRHTLVRSLLEMGASTSKKDGEGFTPLHLAAKTGQGRMVRTLLIEGADINEPDPRGRSALHLACLSGDAMSVQALLAAGSDASRRHDSSGYAALDFAVRRGNNKVSRVLLQKGADINARGRGGWAALHVAVMGNQASAIRFLAQQPGIDMHIEEALRKTPLHMAASEGCLRAAKALVDSGVDVQLRTNGTVRFNYCLQDNDASPLDVAAYRGHLDVVKALVRRGADVRACGNLHSLTPLHHAAAGNRVKVMKYFIKAGAAVDGLVADWRPLHFAVERDQHEAVKVLVLNGADLHSRSHDEGYTPLGQASLQTNLKVMKTLLVAGADPNVNDGTDPALHTAAKSSNPGSEEIVRVLLQHGAEVDAVWDDKQALHGAVLEGTVEIIDLLVDYGADVDGHDSYPSPLHVACKSAGGASCRGRVSALLGHGADIHLLDGEGVSPLHMAAVNSSVEMVDLLLRAGADETVPDEDGKSAADQVRSTMTNSASDKKTYGPIVRLLDGAAEDRVWRRRGFLLLCRAFPGKARLESSLRTRAELPRVSKRGAAAGRWGSRRGGGNEPPSTAQDGGLNNLLARLIRVEEHGIFRKIVCFL